MKTIFLATLATLSACVLPMSANAILPQPYQIVENNTNPQQSLSMSENTESHTVTRFRTPPIFYGTDSELPFSSAVRVGNTLYMSGQIGLKGGKLVQGGVKAETEQALENINQTLLKYGYQKSDLVKCMAMLTDMNDFKAFNEVYKAQLNRPYPVRSAFGVADLALGASVEIECIAAK